MTNMIIDVERMPQISMKALVRVGAVNDRSKDFALATERPMYVLTNTQDRIHSKIPLISHEMCNYLAAVALIELEREVTETGVIESTAHLNELPRDVFGEANGMLLFVNDTDTDTTTQIWGFESDMSSLYQQRILN